MDLDRHTFTWEFISVRGRVPRNRKELILLAGALLGGLGFLREKDGLNVGQDSALSDGYARQ